MIELTEEQKKLELSNDNWKIVPNWSRYEVNQYRILRNKKTKHILTSKDNKRGYLIYLVLRDDDNRIHILSKHKAVALAWIPNPQNLPIINHKDEDKLNCFYQNLEWCTSSYNNSYNETGKKRSEKFKKPFFVYDSERNLIEKRRGINEFCVENNLSSRCASSILKKNSEEEKCYSIKGFYLFYEQITKEDFLQRKQKVFNIGNLGKKKFSKKVYQYDLQNNLLQIYSSVHEVKEKNDLATTSVISACCRNKIKTAYGYKWSYVPL